MSEHSARDTACCLENLRRLDEEFSGLLDARRGHLRELALSLTAGRLSAEQLLSRLSAFPGEWAIPGDTIADNRAFLQNVFSRLALMERVELYRMICAASSPPLAPEHLIPAYTAAYSASARGVIAYQQNAFTDRAYQLFAELLPRARSQYHHTYAGACEAVANGSAEACILPVEHERDGKLHGFYRLIDQYQLKIAYTCSLSPAGDAASRFALLRRSIAMAPDDPELERCLELSVTRSASSPPEQIIDAARLCGFPLRRIDSLPLAAETAGFALHLIFSLAHGVDITPFLLWLSRETPQYNLIGIYSHIPEYE